jgi:hypothetical protein
MDGYPSDDGDWRAEIDRVVREEDDQVFFDNKFMSEREVEEAVQWLRGGKTRVRRLHLQNNSVFGNAGAAALAELLQDNGGENGTAVEEVFLFDNEIGCEGVGALADAIRHNTALRSLLLRTNRGVDPVYGEADAKTGIEALISAIGVNTTLELVSVGAENRFQELVDAALADVAGRLRGREHFLSMPLTKAARTSD